MDNTFFGVHQIILTQLWQTNLDIVLLTSAKYYNTF